MWLKSALHLLHAKTGPSSLKKSAVAKTSKLALSIIDVNDILGGL